ncbi:hypothetical protein D3C76_1772610 [compost metagenome]
MAQGHGRGAGMGSLAAHLDVQPADGLAASHQADGQAGILQDGALLDVRFEVGVELTAQR